MWVHDLAGAGAVDVRHSSSAVEHPIRNRAVISSILICGSAVLQEDTLAQLQNLMTSTGTLVGVFLRVRRSRQWRMGAHVRQVALRPGVRKRRAPCEGIDAPRRALILRLDYLLFPGRG